MTAPDMTALREPAWQSMDTYPPCDLPTCQDPDCDWGPKTLLRVGGLPFVGWKEAGMWLAHDPGEPGCCIEFAEPPDAWAPLWPVTP